MKTFVFPVFRGILTVAVVFALLAGFTGAASASNGALTWQNVSNTFVAYGSCSDPDGVYEITLVSSGAIQYVENANGYKFTWVENGTYYIEPISADSPVTYSGRYVSQFQDHLSSGNSVYKNTFTNVGLGSDGTHEVFHITTNLVVTPSGLVHEVENVQWICS